MTNGATAGTRYTYEGVLRCQLRRSRVAWTVGVTVIIFWFSLSAPRASVVTTGSSESVQFAAGADIGMSSNALSTLQGIRKLDPQFFLALGDLSYAGPNSERRWCAFVKRAVGVRIPVELVSGNHEADFGGDGDIERFSQCLPDRLGAHGIYGQQYYFDYHKLARFIFISPDLTIHGRHYYYGSNNARFHWLEHTIENGRKLGQRWIIVGMHKNCISVGKYYCNIYQDLFTLLIKERVDLVLFGHDHLYQRSRQLATSPRCPVVTVDSFNRACVSGNGNDGCYVKGRGPVFVGVGTAGAPLYPANPHDPEARYLVTYMASNHHPRHGFLSVEVSQTRLSARFIGTTGPSSYIDTFTLTTAPSPQSQRC